ncbi:hypothetical protein KEM52_004565, partial [Ascosphaera acerosa]
TTTVITATILRTWTATRPPTSASPKRSGSSSPSTLNYVLFASAFAMLSLLYLFGAAVFEIIFLHPAISLTLDILNVIFLFCAAIALPSKLHAHSCSNQHYQQTNSIIKGGQHPEKRCREGQATSAFLWFLWFVWMVSLFYSATGMKGRFSQHMSGVRPGRRTQMSQV